MPVDFGFLQQILQFVHACVIPELNWITFRDLLQRLHITAACWVSMFSPNQDELPIPCPSLIIHLNKSFHHDVLFFIVPTCEETSYINNDIIFMSVDAVFFTLYGRGKDKRVHMPVFFYSFLVIM